MSEIAADLWQRTGSLETAAKAAGVTGPTILNAANGKTVTPVTEKKIRAAHRVILVQAA